jgi:cell wall-associated NlpC family hydrolase
MLKAVQIAGLTFALAACATAPGSRPAADGLAPAARSSVPAADSRARIVDGARAMLGQPYRYGGAAPGGFDCSGLVVYATGGAGIRVPRTAREQMHVGAPIERRALRAGDLVFMHLARKDLHVGIAIDNERFVHAPAAGGYVRIDSLAAPRYAHAFLAARRIVDDAASPPVRPTGAVAAIDSPPVPRARPLISNARNSQ